MRTSRSIPRSVRTAAVLLTGMVVGLATPAVARTVVDFAKHAGYANRAGVAKNAHALNRYHADAFITTCGVGSIIAEAVVPADVGSDWTAVQGYVFHHGPGPDFVGRGCPHSEPSARHVSTGVYEVSFSLGICPKDSVGVLVTPAAAAAGGQVVATYAAACSAGSSGIEIHLTDLAGKPVDASFTAAQLDSPAIIP